MLPAFGYVFIAAGILLVRQVIVGRVSETGSDLRDLAVSLLSGDTETAREVAARRGENVSAEVANTSADTLEEFREGNPGNTLGDFLGGTALVTEVVRLGNAASGYTLGATGPDRYDCSGLIWRALKNLNIYTGPRFTTHMFATIANGFADKVDSPIHGDIILWPGEHMGISLGGNRMYSARSTAKGIGESTVSGDSGYFGFRPSYWRVRG